MPGFWDSATSNFGPAYERSATTYQKDRNAKQEEKRKEAERQQRANNLADYARKYARQTMRDPAYEPDENIMHAITLDADKIDAGDVRQLIDQERSRIQSEKEKAAAQQQTGAMLEQPASRLAAMETRTGGMSPTERNVNIQTMAGGSLPQQQEVIDRMKLPVPDEKPPMFDPQQQYKFEDLQRMGVSDNVALKYAGRTGAQIQADLNKPTAEEKPDQLTSKQQYDERINLVKTNAERLWNTRKENIYDQIAQEMGYSIEEVRGENADPGKQGPVTFELNNRKEQFLLGHEAQARKAVGDNQGYLDRINAVLDKQIEALEHELSLLKSGSGALFKGITGRQ